MMTDALHPEALERAATEALGAPIPEGPDDWREALRRLTDALREEAGLAPLRVQLTAPQLIAALVNRGRVLQAHAADPTLSERPIERPVFITGFPRTGTTLMHNLLASHPDHRAYALWQMQTPLPPASAGPDWEEAQIREVAGQLRLLYQLAPEFAAIHPMRAEWPDECSWLFRPTFATLVFAFQYRTPSYMRWLTERDAHPAYRFHRMALQALAARLPGGRVVAKDPCHVWHLDALLEIYPEATVIQLHRHPLEALPSLASLCASLHGFESAHADPLEVGRYALELAERGLSNMLAARRRHPEARIIDVAYRDFVRDPIAAVEALSARLETPWHPGARHRVEDWLAHHPKGKGGAHRYSLEMYGLREGEVLERFGAYIERFGL